MKYRAVFFDFDEVLSKGYFFAPKNNDYPQVAEFVDKVIFNGPEKIAARWMRGEFTYENIIGLIAKNTDVSLADVNRLFIESIQEFQINEELIDYAVRLKEAGVGIALVTDNMDVFDRFIRPLFNLDNIFPVIINSAEFGALKHEADGLLFNEARKQLHLNSFEGTVLIDNSEKACGMFKDLGGEIHQFKGMNEFHEWRLSNRGFTDLEKE